MRHDPARTDIARALVAPDKGILAADESSGTIEKRFKSIERREHRGEPPRLPRDAVHHRGRRGVHQRRDPLRRDDAPEGEGRHAASRRCSQQRGIIPGIKVDKGTKPLPFAEAEKITEGLDGLRERLAEYRGLGARFAKWRAVIDDRRRHPERHLHRDQRPRARALRRAVRRGRARADRRARGADGRPHTIERCYEATERTLRAVFARSERAARAARADPAQAEHGALGHRVPAAGERARGRRADAALLPQHACRRPCRASCSSRAARATSSRPRT